ncbi:FkbM family methyltransferase [Paraglaciecola sp. L3A3]|uniref:FkbM family methyltransferase n=1 Tax=Paraglaciecola sp. L3A3 TaxID=2686358 RepID=UPI001E43648D|nr:FkbM family methyltransferase [Paraglaciecola sp. L3A3]
MNICPDVVIKIDVEGQEVQAINGAQKLIKDARSLVILLEIHPEVLTATSTTTEQLFTALESIRPVKWIVPILGNCKIDRNDDFFNQFPMKQYDVIAILD